MDDDPVTNEQERREILAAMRAMDIPLNPQEHPPWIADKELRHVRRAHPVQRDPTEDDLLPFSGDVWVRDVGNGRDTCTRWQEPDQKPQCPPSITVTLTTTPEHFATWVDDLTKDYGNRVFVCGYRSVTFSSFIYGKPTSVRCAWNKGDTGTVRWTLYKRWLETYQGRESVGAAAIDDQVLVKLNCLPLSSEQTQVRMECFGTWVWEYFWTDYIDMWRAIRRFEMPGESREAIDAYLKELGDEPDSQAVPAQGKPWEAIKGVREQEMVRLWWQGWDKGKIAEKFHPITAKTVENLFSLWRKSHGKDVVPLANDPRRSSFKNRE